MVITVIMRPWQAASQWWTVFIWTDLPALAGLEAPKEQELSYTFQGPSQATVLTLGTLRKYLRQRC